MSDVPSALSPPRFAAGFFIRSHDGRRTASETIWAIPVDGKLAGEITGCRWEAQITAAAAGEGEGCDVAVEFRVISGVIESGAVGIRWEDAAWSTENYVLVPGAVYRGNRFSALERPYPPAARDIGQRRGALVCDISDIPRLNEGEGSSHLDQTSLDAAVPGLGVYFPRAGECFLLLTRQLAERGFCHGYEVVENEDRSRAALYWSVPGFAHEPGGSEEDPAAMGTAARAASHPENGRPVTLRAGESLHWQGRIIWRPAGSVHDLFRLVFEQRGYAAAGEPEPGEVLPFSAAKDMIVRKYEADNWDESHGLYKVGLPWLPRQDSQFWQNGWLGGGIPILPLAADGDGCRLPRVLRNLGFLLGDGVSARGFFKAIMSPEGRWAGDGFADWDGGPEPWSLARRTGDGLFFAVRLLMFLEQIGVAVPDAWRETISRVSAALCDLWRREGDWGFLIDYESAELVVRGSTSGALIPGALVLASRFLGNRELLSVAAEAAASFCQHDLHSAVTVGGPGDAVQAPDSESVCALLESLVLLHEETGDRRWLTWAEQAAWQAASWVISHKHVFPAQSALGRLGMDVRGTIFANAQNKCAVPGICTLSGEGIFRLFRATGDRGILDLIRSIAHAIPQFVSTSRRPIPARIGWGHPGKSHLPEGWICERVNTTPWWGEPLGEQAAYSCWCEVAMLLTWNDLPGVYAQPDSGVIANFDHVRASWSTAERTSLTISNPTAYPARVKIFSETAGEARSTPLPVNHGMMLEAHAIPAGATVEVRVQNVGTP